MKYLNLILCLMLLLFIAVQFNDPDGLLWMVIYGIPAIWCATTALRPGWLSAPFAPVLLGLSTLAAITITVYYWPNMSEWWTKDVWWEEETAREGMGAMIVLAVMLVVAVSFWLQRKNFACK